MSKHKMLIVEIYNHNIQYWLDKKSVKKLSISDIDYIKSSISNGFTSGELAVAYGKKNNLISYGWWKIVDWESISLELYNALKLKYSDKLKSKKLTSHYNQLAKLAIKNFEKHWY